ncbi:MULTISPECIES: MT-A70 family methyltransferase [Rhodopirellula]|uniref:MT-A70 family methyltransferase n=1 Tax=Rhodopirellula TaxID=265488 RepID=UPI0013045690|nr:MULTISPECIES: MT-A70 family methyltransferase [Rhodopirellula]WDQ17005.1 MT-A70 family methyltransferase [Rhodopirellula sp. P2]
MSTASRALCEAKTVDEVKDIRDKAEAVKAYARKAKLGHSILVEAALVKVRAERKLGCILSETELAKASPGNQFTVADHATEDGAPTLASLGITKSDSSRLQRIARLPEDVFQGYLSESVEAEREPTTAGLLKLAKRQSKPSEDATQTYGEKPAGSEGLSTVSLHEIINSGTKFGTILAEPLFLQRRSVTDVTIPIAAPALDDLCSMPVSAIASDNAHLHLWSHAEMLLDALDVLEAWGFEYRSCFVWVETTEAEECDFWQSQCRFLLLGYKGNPSFGETTCRNWLKLNPQQRDSRHATIRKLVQKVSPGPYMQLFVPEAADGWTTAAH